MLIKQSVLEAYDPRRSAPPRGRRLLRNRHTPNTEFLAETDLERDEGYLRTESDDVGRATTETAVAGVSPLETLQTPTTDRRSTASGTGSMAALDAETHLEALEDTTETTSLEVSP